jgi:S-methylmethionine-dependent homocysteine/selenocysteine methylase
MSTHGYWLMSIATFAFTTGYGATANESQARLTESLLAARQTLAAEIAAAARDSLRAATPEIALPAIHVETLAPVVAER